MLSAYMITLPLAFRAGSTGSLDQRSLAAQEALFVGIQDGHQGHFREVQTLPQQIDPHQNVEFTEPQVF